MFSELWKWFSHREKWTGKEWIRPIGRWMSQSDFSGKVILVCFSTCCIRFGCSWITINTIQLNIVEKPLKEIKLAKQAMAECSGRSNLVLVNNWIIDISRQSLAFAIADTHSILLFTWLADPVAWPFTCQYKNTRTCNFRLWSRKRLARYSRVFSHNKICNFSELQRLFSFYPISAKRTHFAHLKMI
jgi:hypothetical protein